MTDVTNVQTAYQMMTRMVIRSPLMFIFSMTAAFRISSEISFIFIICLPILAVGTHVHSQDGHAPLQESVPYL